MPKLLDARSSKDSSNDSIAILSRLLLSPLNGAADIASITRDEFEDLVALANLNHVTMRAFQVFLSDMREAGDEMRASWAAGALAVEGARIQNATTFLHAICAAFAEDGHEVTVIKSLDHWPDLGSDLDLYTDAKAEDIFHTMKKHFNAQFAPRSWGDRLARKWNFLLPGLPEPVEVHMGRLGQTGEQVAIASTLIQRARMVSIEDYTFPVPSASDRLMISTLQRMYRHFFFRLCDIIDTAELCDAGAINFDDLRHSAQLAGIWEGVATYLMIVSDYVKRYRGSGLRLPRAVEAAARFGGGELSFRDSFLRVPIMPQSACLYGLQLTGLLRRRKLHSTARLGLLPWLATAAMVGQKLTGSDKGVW